jgi:MoaA/NifB/PqqE/SkfB family radical SAM enzyme
MKQYRVNGLSFEEELRGKTIPFGERIIYLGLNGALQTCNWACKYCLEGSPQERKISIENGLSLDEQIKLIDKAADLGAETLLVTGGEPFAPKKKEETITLVNRAYKRDLVPLIYTNGSYLDAELAYQLADNGASVALKIDSLVPEKYDKLTQRKGAYESTMKAIEAVKRTSISEPIAENDCEILVRLLFTTVGNALNVDEYASIARFATNHGARWMMESLNLRGDAPNYPELSLDWKRHAESMKYALMLNPQQGHNIDEQGYCRLFFMVTVNTTSGMFGICPQDYESLGNIRETTLEEVSAKVLKRVNNPHFRIHWNTGKCPIKENHFVPI